MGLLAYGDTGWGDELFFATLMTIAVAAAAIFIGFFLAAIFASFKLSKFKTLNLIGSFYTTVFRGVPELLVIYLFFFGGSGAVMYVARIFGYDGYIEVNAFITGAISIGIISGAYSTEVFRGVPELLVIYLFFFGGSGAVMYVAKIFGYDGYIEINAFITGAVSIGVISGAYSTEVFRGAVQSINKGQFEASEVLGFKKRIYYYKVIIPQMLRLALPNISNVWQITLKDTSLISVTGLVEIMRQSYIAAGSTRDPLFFYSFAALLYLILTFLSMKILNKLEKNYSRGF